MPQPLDTTAVTDEEIARAFAGVRAALLILDGLLDIATARQIEAVFGPCPYGNYDDVRLDYDAWVAVVLDGTSGLRVDNTPAIPPTREPSP